MAIKAKKDASKQVVILELKIDYMEIRLVGDSPLISHRWSEKAKKEIRDKQMKKAKQAKEIRNPEQDFRESLYEHPNGGYGFPAVAFKTAAVNACSHVADITKVVARGSFHVVGELIQIEGEPTMREDMVRIGMGTADLRYRGEFKTWACTLQVRYNTSVISAEQIVNLFNIAGFAVGVGEWRPQKDGSYGMFHVEL